MSNTTKTIIIVLVIGVLLSLLLYTCNQNRLLKSQNVVYVHDTTKKDVYIHDTTKGTVVYVPNHQIYYDTVKDDHVSKVVFDTLKKTLYLIDTLRSYVLDSFNTNFLTRYPQSSKLILGKFDNTTTRLDLLNTNGEMESKIYQVDYSKHRYEFFNNQLRQIDTTFKGSFWKQIYTESYIYTTYNPFTQGANIRVDYSLMYKGIGITAFGGLSTDQTPNFNGGIGLKAKIK